MKVADTQAESTSEARRPAASAVADAPNLRHASRLSRWIQGKVERFRTFCETNSKYLRNSFAGIVKQLLKQFQKADRRSKAFVPSDEIASCFLTELYDSLR